MKTILIGLGNPVLTDDGVGVKIAYEVEKALQPDIPKDLTITEASVGGLRLMELLIGYDRVILVDAIKTGHHSAGTIHKMTLEDLRAISPTQHSSSAHDTSLITALDTAAILGFHVPKEISIYAIEVENILEFSEESTPAVAAAIPKVTTAILEEIRNPSHTTNPLS